MKDVAIIMVVDDESINRGIIKHTLEDDFKVHCVNSGQQCIEEVHDIMPDVILMDILMPGIDGYETCEILKKDKQIRHIPVIFVSAMNTVKHRLKAYNLEARDFITKPFDLDELNSKVRIAVNMKKEHDQLVADILNVTDVAYAAMNMSSESGLVSQFIENSFSCNNYQEVADKIFEAMRAFGLSAAFQISFDNEVVDFNPEGIYKPLESELIMIVKAKGRLFNFGPRMFINYKNSSILIKNMPLDDPDKCGRLRDHLAMIGSAADARIRAMKTQLDLKKHLSSRGIIKTVAIAIESLETQYKNDRLKTLNITQMMGQDIEESLLQLGLEVDQETRLMDSIDKATKELIAVFSNEDLISETFSDLMVMMKKSNLS